MFKFAQTVPFSLLTEVQSLIIKERPPSSGVKKEVIISVLVSSLKRGYLYVF